MDDEQIAENNLNEEDLQELQDEEIQVTQGPGTEQTVDDVEQVENVETGQQQGGNQQGSNTQQEQEEVATLPINVTDPNSGNNTNADPNNASGPQETNAPPVPGQGNNPNQGGTNQNDNNQQTPIVIPPPVVTPPTGGNQVLGLGSFTPSPGGGFDYGFSNPGATTGFTFNASTSTSSFQITTGSGGDTITLGSGNDSINTGAGNDVITAGGGNDVVNAGSGDDTIIAGSGEGDDYYDGGDGYDSLTYDSVSGANIANLSVTLNALSEDSFLDDGTATVIDNDTFTNINYLRLGAGDDTVLVNTSGIDVDAAGGYNTLDLNPLQNGITYNFGTGILDDKGVISTLTNFDAIYGTSGSDVITVTSIQQEAHGNGGQDTLIVTDGSLSLNLSYSESVSPVFSDGEISQAYSGFERVVHADGTIDIDGRTISANDGDARIGNITLYEFASNAMNLAGSDGFILSGTISLENAHGLDLATILDVTEGTFAFTENGTVTHTEVDINSGGRLIIGSGTGYAGQDYDAISIDVNSGGVLEIADGETVSLNGDTARYRFKEGSTLTVNGEWYNSIDFFAFDTSTTTVINGEGSIVNIGTLRFDDDILNVDIENFDSSAEADGLITLGTADTLTLNASIQGGSIALGTDAVLDGSGSLQEVSRLTLSDGADLAVADTSISGELAFSGSVSVSGRLDMTQGAFDGQADAVISVAYGAEIEVSSNTDKGLDGTIAFGNGATLSVAEGSVFTNVQTPVASTDQQVNATDSGNQSIPDIARLSNGNYVVVWEQAGNDKAAIVDPLGNLILEFDATGSTGGEQTPRVTAMEDGRFMIAYNQKNAETTIMKYWLFNNDGSYIGEFHELIGGTGINWVDFDVFSFGSDGYGYVTRNSSTSSFSVKYFSTDATESTTTIIPGLSIVEGARTATLSDGRVAIVYGVLDSGDVSVRVTFVNPATAGQSTATVATSSNFTGAIDVAALSDGSSVVVYSDGYDVFAQIIDSTGNPIGSQITVTGDNVDGAHPTVVALADGGFQVLFESTDFDIYTRQYDSSGAPVGPLEIIASNTTGQQFSAVAVPTADGDGVSFAYVGPGSDGNDIFFGTTSNTAPGGTVQLGQGAILEGPGIYRVEGDDALDGVTIGSTGTLDNDAVLTLGSNGLTVQGTFDNAGGTLAFSSNSHLTVETEGTVTLDGVFDMNGGASILGGTNGNVLLLEGMLTSNNSGFGDVIGANLEVGEDGTIIVGGADGYNGSLTLSGSFLNNGFVRIEQSNQSEAGVLIVDHDFTNAETIQIGNGGTLVVNEGEGTFTNTGILTGQTSGIFSPAVIQAGAIQNTGLIAVPGFGEVAGTMSIQGAVIDSTDGDIEISAGGRLILDSSTLMLGTGSYFDNNNGGLIVGNGGVLDLGAGFTIQNDIFNGTIEFQSGSTLGGSGTLSNAGTMDLGGVTIDAVFENESTEGGGGEIYIAGGETLTVNGVLNSFGNAEIILDLDSVLNGTGTITGENALELSGSTISAGLTYIGDISYDHHAAMTIDGMVTGQILDQSETGGNLNGSGLFTLTGGTISGSGQQLATSVDVVQTGVLSFLNGGGQVTVNNADWIMGDNAFIGSLGTLSISSEARLGVADGITFGYDSASMGVIDFTDGAEIFGTGTFANASGSSLSVDGDLTSSVATLANAGSFAFNYGTMTVADGLLANSGQMTVTDGTLRPQSDGNIANTGTILFNGAMDIATLHLEDDMVNAGTLVFDSTGYEGSAEIIGDSGAELLNTGLIRTQYTGSDGFPLHEFQIDIINQGTIEINSATRFGQGEGVGPETLETRDGTITIAENTDFGFAGTLVVGSDSTINGIGTLSLNGGSSLRVAAGETFSLTDDVQLIGTDATVEAPITVAASNGAESRIVALSNGNLLVLYHDSSAADEVVQLRIIDPETGNTLHSGNITEGSNNGIYEVSAAEMSDGSIRVAMSYNNYASFNQVKQYQFISDLGTQDDTDVAVNSSVYENVAIVAMDNGGYAIATSNATEEEVTVTIFDSSDMIVNAETGETAILGDLDILVDSNGNANAIYSTVSSTTNQELVRFIVTPSTSSTQSITSINLTDTPYIFDSALLTNNSIVTAVVVPNFGTRIFFRTNFGTSSFESPFDPSTVSPNVTEIKVEATSDDGFIVAWVIDNGTGNSDIYAQKFDNAGTAIGDAINLTVAGDGSETVGAAGDQSNFDLTLISDTEIAVSYNTVGGIVLISTATLGEMESVPTQAVIDFGYHTVIDGAGVLSNERHTEAGTLEIASGASLANSGTLDIEGLNITTGGAVSNTGSLLVTGGTLTVEGALSGAGLIGLRADQGDQALADFVGNYQNDGTLVLDNLSGSQAGDVTVRMGESGDGTLTNTGEIRISDTGGAGLGVKRIDGNLTNTGSIFVDSELKFGTVLSEGPDQVLNSVNGTIDIDNTERLTVDNGTVLFGSNTVFTGGGTLHLTEDTTLSVATGGTFTHNEGVILVQDGTISGPGGFVNASGSISLDDGAVDLDGFVNQGLITVTAGLSTFDSQGFRNAEDGLIRIRSDLGGAARLQLLDAVTNDGTIVLSSSEGSGNSSTLTHGDAEVLTNTADGTISLESDGGSQVHLLDVNIVNNGRINLDVGGSLTAGHMLDSSNGTISIAEEIEFDIGGTLLVGNDTVLEGLGDLVINSGGALTIAAGESFTLAASDDVSLGSEATVPPSMSDQFGPEITRLPNGHVWGGWSESFFSNPAIQRYDASGNPLGSTIRINEFNEVPAGNLNLVTLSNGTVAAVYTIMFGQSSEIYVDIYDSSGNLLTDRALKVPTEEDEFIFEQVLGLDAAAKGDGFVISYANGNGDVRLYSYDQSGIHIPQSTESVGGDHVPGTNTRVVNVAGAGESFDVVIYTAETGFDEETETPIISILAVIQENGSDTVDVITLGETISAASVGVASLGNDTFVAVWVDGYDAYAMIRSTDASQSSPSPILIAEDASNPSVIALNTGGFLVGYEIGSEIGSSVYVQEYNAAGAPVGQPVLIDSGPLVYSTNIQMVATENGYSVAYQTQEGQSGETVAVRLESPGPSANLVLDSGSSVDGTGTLVIEATKTVEASGATLAMGALDNDGVISVFGAALHTDFNTITGNGEIQIGSTSGASGTLFLMSDLTNQAGHRIELSSLDESASMAGTITGVAGATLTNAGVIAGDFTEGDQVLDLDIVNTGSITFQGGAVLTTGHELDTRDGTVVAQNYSQLNIEGTILVGSDSVIEGLITLDGGTFNVASGETFTLEMFGDTDLSIGSGGGVLGGSGTLVNEGYVDLSNATISSGLNIANTGVVFIEGGNLTIQTATFDNASGTLAVIVDDEVSSTLTINAAMTNAGVIDIDLNGGQLSGLNAVITSDNDSTLTNSGLLRSDGFSYNSGTLVLSSDILNTGTIDVLGNGEVSGNTQIDSRDGTIRVTSYSDTVVGNLQFLSGSTLIAGTDTVLESRSGQGFYAGSIAFAAGALLSVAAGETFTLASDGLDLDFSAGGELGGAGTLVIASGASLDLQGIVLSVANIINLWSMGTRGGTLVLSDLTVDFSAGTLAIEATSDGNAQLSVTEDTGFAGTLLLDTISGGYSAAVSVSEGETFTLTGTLIARDTAGSEVTHDLFGTIVNEGMISFGVVQVDVHDHLDSRNGRFDIGDAGFLNVIGTLTVGTDTRMIGDGTIGITSDGTLSIAAGETFAYGPQAQDFATNQVANTTTTGNQIRSNMIQIDTGDIWVAWDDENGNADRIQRFSSDGTPLGSEILVNQGGDFAAKDLQLIEFSNGEIGAVYFIDDGSNTYLMMEKFDSDGDPIMEEDVPAIYTLRSFSASGYIDRIEVFEYSGNVGIGASYINNSGNGADQWHFDVNGTETVGGQLGAIFGPTNTDLGHKLEAHAYDQGGYDGLTVSLRTTSGTTNVQVSRWVLSGSAGGINFGTTTVTDTVGLDVLTNNYYVVV